MSEFSTIIIKTSTTSATPPVAGHPDALAVGELAYSFVSGKLFIGVSDLATYPAGYRLVNDTAELSTDQLNAVNQLIASAIATEVTNRNTAIGVAAQTAADNLTAAIATEVGERDVAISNAIAAEATARNGAIADAIATEVVNRNSAITNAIAAENIEQIRVDVARKVEQSDIDAAITQEVSARNGAIDAALLAGKDANFDNLTVQNLVVNGTTTTVNSEQTNIKDPVIELGVNPNPAGDNYNRGIKYHYADGGPKTGFFGVSSTERDVFEFIPETTGIDTFTGAKGKVRADLLGNADTATAATTATKLAQSFEVSFGGDVSATPVQVDGSSAVQFNLSLNNAEVEAVSNSFVKRDADGSVKAKHIIASGAGSRVKGFVIHGGTF